MSNENSDRNYYMIRMTRGNVKQMELIDYAEKNKVIAVGWGWGVDLSEEKTVDEAKQKVKNEWPGMNIQSFSVVADIFITMLKAGDIIITPAWSEVIISEVVENKDGKIKFFNGSEEAGRLDMRNQISVKRLGWFPRSLFKTGVQNYLRNRMTAGYMTKFAEDIDEVIEGGCITLDEKNKKTKEEAEKELYQHLQQAIYQDSNLQAGGKGFEKLLSGILKAQGLEDVEKAKITRDSIADVDIKAKFTPNNPLFKDYIRYYIQAKHHQGTEGDWGIKQLIEHPDDDEALTTVKVLITSADTISKEADELAKKNNIDVITANDFISDMIIPNLAKLGDETLQGLGLIKLDNGFITYKK